jgi:hypothetical protein
MAISTDYLQLLPEVVGADQLAARRPGPDVLLCLPPVPCCAVESSLTKRPGRRVKAQLLVTSCLSGYLDKKFSPGNNMWGISVLF